MLTFVFCFFSSHVCVFNLNGPWTGVSSKCILYTRYDFTDRYARKSCIYFYATPTRFIFTHPLGQGDSFKSVRIVPEQG